MCVFIFSLNVIFFKTDPVPNCIFLFSPIQARNVKSGLKHNHSTVDYIK